MNPNLQRDLGYDGQTLIHPSHVAPVHEVYTPSAEEVEFYQGMIEAFEKAAATGAGSVDYGGQACWSWEPNQTTRSVKLSRPQGGAFVKSPWITSWAEGSRTRKR